MNATIMFGQVLDLAAKQINPFGPAFGGDIVLVRDLFGRIRVLLPRVKEDYDADKLNGLAAALSGSLDRYAFPPEEILLFAPDLLDGDRLFSSPDRHLLTEENGLRLWLLDRQLIGQDWTRGPLHRETRNHRVTFFGIKGGVGRSTALIIWAWRLAKQGQDVLVVDLDLESPGLSSTLLPPEFLPDYGVVDWFVEDAVGQAEVVERSLLAESPLSKDLAGRIQVLPAYGRDTGDYLPKLARCYLEPAGAGAAWGERLQRLVESVERRVLPQVTFLDSRAGLHDIAAVTVTRMDADAFLFAVDSAQTWIAYSFLFSHWRQHPQLTEFRRRLQIAAGMVPETQREEHLRRFTEHAWDLFREHLYDEAAADSPDTAYSFDLDSEEAPHYPLPVFWNRALQEFDPCRSPTGLDEQIAEAALGRFMTEAEHMVFTQEAST